MLENSTAGLYMLDPARDVTVTREEDHQHALARYPVTYGYPRRVAVELAWCTATKGKHKGEPAIEVRLDGDRVGELTHAMTQRYAPLVESVMALHGRPGCEATIAAGERGLQIEVHLPPAGASLPALPAYTPPAPMPYASPAPMPYAPPAPRAKKSRVPLTFAGAVVGMVAVISGIASLGEDSPSAQDPANHPITVTTTVPTTTTTVRITTTTPKPTTTTTRPTPTTTRPKPKPTTVNPAPPPPPPETESNCDPNYSGCVPISSDVDCEGGSGNGPAYVAGPVRVIGSDIYELDRDNDGIGCE